MATGHGYVPSEPIKRPGVRLIGRGSLNPGRVRKPIFYDWQRAQDLMILLGAPDRSRFPLTAPDRAGSVGQPHRE